MFNKPNYIDEQYVEATNHGWIDNRTGEVLVAIPRMLDRMKAKGIEIQKEEKTLLKELVNVQPINISAEVIDTSKAEEPVEEKQGAITDLLDVLKKVQVKKEDEEKVVKRGRPRKVQEPAQEGVVVSKRRGRPKKNG